MMRAQDQQVLVVEPDAALRRIIAVGLRQRGFDVGEARTLGDIWETLDAAPAAVVLDVGLGLQSEWLLVRSLRAHRVLGAVPVVLLAWECPVEAVQADDPAVRRVCLTKPFDARALYEAIESVLRVPAHASAPAEGSAARTSDVPIAVVTAHAQAQEPVDGAPSIWPLVTAIGATLAVAGFLVQVAFVAVGLLIVVAAILLWAGEATEPARWG